MLIVKRLKDEGNFEVFKGNPWIGLGGFALCSLLGSFSTTLYAILLASWIIFVIIDTWPFMTRTIIGILDGKEFRRKGLKYYFEK